MWPQRVELRFTGKIPIAGETERALPSGAGGYPIRGKFVVTEDQKAEVRWAPSRATSKGLLQPQELD